MLQIHKGQGNSCGRLSGVEIVIFESKEFIVFDFCAALLKSNVAGCTQFVDKPIKVNEQSLLSI